jgi:hypothetical protein
VCGTGRISDGDCADNPQACRVTGVCSGINRCARRHDVVNDDDPRSDGRPLRGDGHSPQLPFVASSSSLSPFIHQPKAINDGKVTQVCHDCRKAIPARAKPRN